MKNLIYLSLLLCWASGPVGSVCGQRLAATVYDKKWGFIDEMGQTVIEHKYEAAQNFSERRAGVQLLGKWGFVNPKGVMAVAAQFDEVQPFRDGCAPVRKGEMWGFIDSTGKWLLAPAYTWVYGFENGIAPVQQNGKWGVINKVGATIVPFKYNYFLGPFVNGFAVAKVEHSYCVIDRQGRELTRPDILNAYHYSEGLLPCKRKDGWGYLGENGATVIPFQYEWATPYREGLAVIKLRGKYGVINSQGLIVADPTYDDYRFGYSEGLLVVKRNGKWGYIDGTGRTLIPFEWDERYGYPKPFSFDRAAVQKDGGWGYIDHSGKLVIPHKFYGEAYPFVDVNETVRP